MNSSTCTTTTTPAVVLKLECMYSTVSTFVDLNIQDWPFVVAILTPVFRPFVTGSGKPGWCHVADE